MRKRQILGVGQDHIGTPRRIEHHLGRLELGDVIVEAAHLERRGRHEAMAARLVAGFDAPDLEVHNFRLFGLRPKCRDDRMQRAHPSEPPAAPAHGLRPGKRAHDLRHHLADHINRRPALLLDHRHVEVALLGILLDLGLADQRQAGRFEEAGDRAFGRADARALLLFLDVRLAHQHAVHRQREPARRREGLGAFVDEAGRHQPVGDHFLQIVGGARLHARGDFLRQKFKQEVGHYASFLWLPSQVGLRVLRLQVQKNTFSLFAALNSIGVKEVALCEPSQNGCVFERPQAHHQ